MTKSYHICSVIVKINDEDIFSMPLVPVSMLVEVDEEKLNSIDPEEHFDYGLKVAKETVRKALPSIIDQSRAFVDFKMTIDAIEIASISFGQEFTDALVISRKYGRNTLRKHIVEIAREEVLEKINKEFSRVILLLKIIGDPTPTKMKIEVGGTYDDVSDVYFYTDPLLSSTARVNDRALSFNLYATTDISESALLEEFFVSFLNNYIGGDEIIEGGLVDIEFELTPQELTLEETADVLNRLYYHELEWVYDADNLIDITVGEHQSLYEEGELIPFREVINNPEHRDLRKGLNLDAASGYSENNGKTAPAGDPS